MELILLAIALIIVFSICSWVIWPLRTLWWLLKYVYKQRYNTSFFHVDYVPQDKPAVLLSTHVNLFVAVLVRAIAKQHVTMVFREYNCPSKLVRRLLDKCNIQIIFPKDLKSWDKTGILIIRQTRFKEVVEFDLPIVPLDVCGFEHAKHEGGPNVSQLLHLNFAQSLDIDLSDKARVDLLSNYNIQAWDHHVSNLPTLPELWIRQAKARRNDLVLADSMGVELTGTKMLTAVLTMSKKLEPLLREQNRIGICLPPSVGGTMAMLSVMMQGKTMVNLNYTASTAALNAAIDEAGVETILTSGKFIEQLKKKGFFLEEIFSTCNIVLLEDVKQEIDKLSLLLNLLRVKTSNAQTLIKNFVNKVSIDHEAVILFSSESLPMACASVGSA